MVLVYFTRRRKDLPFFWMFWLFAAFIVGCGTTHLMEVITTYVPLYRLAGLIKAVTAVASIATAILLVPLVPKALALRSPRELEREIEERKQAQRDLEAQARTLREQALLLDLAHDSILVRDLGDQITFWNQGAVEMYGWSKEEAVGQVTHTLLQTTLPEPLDEIRATLLRQGRWEGELTHTRRDGAQIVVLSRWALRRDDRGEPVGALEINRDITARKQAEAALQQANADLERRVAERTADLLRAKSQLEEADRRKDQFVMMLAHELRNPLAPLRNGLYLLQLSQGNGQVVQQARTLMERQVSHMARIIEDLLDVSRLLRGRVELRSERLDLGRVVRHALEDQRPAFERGGVSLDADLPDVPTWVNGDQTRLTQVVTNFLQNALKFTDRGGRVTVRLEADRDCGQAVLAVRDTGMGIERNLLPHLFEPFTQADRSLDRNKGGLGLGLALVKGLVELHGGTVEAHSEGPGRGAEFVVRLPLQPEPAAVSDLPASSGRALKRLRVLVVEDNRDAADSLKLLLDLFGCEVRVAYTGPSGVAVAREWKPDVVLCDIGLPGLDGYGVARELRGDPATAQARMIAVTGYGGDQDRERSHQAGFDAHLTKPADPAALRELLATP